MHPDAHKFKYEKFSDQMSQPETKSTDLSLKCNFEKGH